MQNTCEHPQVLVVDDDAFNISGARSIYGILNIKIMKADNGLEALEILMLDNRNGYKDCPICKGNFKYVLMDINMPVMDGLEACRLFKQKVEEGVVNDCLVFCCSAHQTLFDNEEQISSGMNDYIPKPISIEKIQQINAKYNIKL